MNRPIVETCNGKISGSIERSVLNEEFWAFRGIPYAKAPIGQLRFQDPEPAESWSGIKESTNFGSSCTQFNFFTNSVEGSEDCLYLNVYAKCIDSSKRRAVMVWVHGGGFVCGDGNDTVYGPDYLLRKDIIVVTMNYRLGVLGFLNLEDDIAPGNQGLKDQVMALKWVQNNIENFGGDPGNVTIFGESAGGAAVHYLSISPLAKGLFHKVISQSGVIFNPWALRPNPKEFAYRMCDLLGNKIRDHKAIINFLRTIDSKVLAEIQAKILTPEEKMQMVFPFGPGIDAKSKNPFMPIHPEKAAQEGIQYPLLIGYVDKEGIVALNDQLIGDNFDKFKTQPFEKFMNSRAMKIIENYNITPDDLRRMYCKNEELNRENERLIDLLGDLHFVEGIHRIVKIQVEKSCAPTYLYQYSFDNGASLWKFLYKTDMKGASHGDELPYLFYGKMSAQFGAEPLNKGTPEYELMEKMTDLWTNFAITGRPTPHTNDLIPLYWQPVNSGKELRCLNIDEDLRMKIILNLEEIYCPRKKL